MSNVEFIEESHTYVNSKGIVIPSVSEIIRFKFPDAYQGVPTEILKKKASYGTKVHGMIEDFVRGKFTLEELKTKKIDPNIKVAVEQFEILRKKWCFYIKDMEQVVDYKERVAGQFDLLTEDNKIIDIKTTSVIHEDWLSVQLGFYQLMLGIDTNEHYCLWVPKGKSAKVLSVHTLTNEECKEILKEYEKHNSN